MEETQKKKSSFGKVLLVLVLLFIILPILVALFSIWMLTHPGNPPEVIKVEHSFSPASNQILLPEDDLSALIKDSIPELPTLGINEIVVDTRVNQLRFYTSLTLKGGIFPYLNRNTRTSLDMEIALFPKGDLYRMDVLRLKIGKLPIPVKLVKRILSRYSSSLGPDITLDNSGILVDVKSFFEQEIDSSLIQALYLREGGVLLMISTSQLEQKGIGSREIGQITGAFKQSLLKDPIESDSENIQQWSERVASLPSSSEEKKLTARISYLEGNVELLRENEPWLAGFGEEVYSGDILEVLKNSYCEIVLPEGSLLKLSEGTVFVIKTLDFKENSRTVESELTEGMLAAKVAKLTLDDSRFEIDSGGTVMGIRGTSFTIENSSDGVTLKVQEGLVAMTDDSGEVQVSESMKAESKKGTKLQALPMNEAELKEMEETLEFSTPDDILQSYQSDGSMDQFSKIWDLYIQYTEMDQKDKTQVEDRVTLFLEENQSILQKLESTF